MINEDRKCLKKSELILFTIVFVVVSLWSLLAFGIDKEFRKCAGCHKIEEGKKAGIGVFEVKQEVIDILIILKILI